MKENMLTFQHFNEINNQRALSWHEADHWSKNDWMIALVGEIGEAANILKKLKRSEDGLKGNKETDETLQAGLAEELADSLTYLFLVAERCGVDLETATINKFNKVSKRLGFVEKL